MLIVFFFYAFVFKHELFDGDLLQISIHSSGCVDCSALWTFISVAGAGFGFMLFQAVFAKEDVALIAASGVDRNRFAY